MCPPSRRGSPQHLLPGVLGASRAPCGCPFIHIFAEARINLPFLPGYPIQAPSSKQIKKMDAKPKAILGDFQLCRHLANPVARAGGFGGPRMAVNIPPALGQDCRQGTGTCGLLPKCSGGPVQKFSLYFSI